MKKLLLLIILILFLILLWFSWSWYKEAVVCCEDSKPVKEIVEKPLVSEKDSFSLEFKRNNSNPVIGDLWSTKFNDLIGEDSKNKTLMITGRYYQEEENTSNYDNIGLARAEAVKNLFKGKIDLDKIETTSKVMDSARNTKSGSFDVTDFKWLVRNENIKEIDNKALIYFPKNSSNKHVNENIDAYLKDVAILVIKSGKSIYLTGFTDNSGEAAYNKVLGQKRANELKRVLMSDGVPADRIFTSSKGEEAPIASNNTQEGKKKNRRVELEIK